ncbi:dUTP diphosphatase [Helicobacter winghamensis]|uniref:Deoxyuridine 5'-triphosphate nucleotidohydrolase n=1 Tax=Helicobacter winghamensis TaxID=157268 RepID=A0A2N3PIV2_9HELI|nr:dUTP diphosphatase [Helicobacter winghamensis]PKT76480.1 deoxyuridine 5'-triphosphate nucleotidohydrolase [Helicobacter winghamensis]PKT80860.1 deoxyuridine 5'-triphosphate nucleotidohydrolase [Helicobacter winghamensis]PKT81275.1 deoxyuridine 5'-triphosphate nucleotidohydrolase [Helicobacter winghamensis]
MAVLKIKLLSPNATLPQYQTSGASGFDLCASENTIIRSKEFALVPTGLSFSFNEKYEIQIRPRSGLALKYGISVLNTPGTIDSDYRGEIKVLLINHSKEDFKVNIGDRIAQAVLCPIEKAEIEVVEVLENTDRGIGGFGSTGK